jgi:hypothetical protein
MYTDMHASSGTRTHGPSVSAGEDSSCLRRRGHGDLQVNTVFSEIKRWNSKHLRKLENHTNALAVNLLDNSETTHRH